MKIFLQKIGGFLVGKLGSLAGWVAQLFLPKLLEALKDWLLLRMKERELKKKDETLLVEYKEAVASKEMTREERRKMAERLLNRDA